MRIYARGLVLLLCVLLLAGCSQAGIGVLDSPLSPLAVPDPTPVPSPFPTPEPGTGGVHGRLLPAEGVTQIVGELFLAKVIPTSDPDIQVPSLDPNYDPKAQLDRETYEFAFTNVPPGKYALVIWMPFSSQLVNDPETGFTLMFEVEEGEVLDLGQLDLSVPTEDSSS